MMRRLFVVVAAVAAMMVPFGGALAVPSSDTEQVCRPGDSGKIDVSGEITELTITAPEGYLIMGYCVKAGSAQQGLGPEYVRLDPAVESVTISHSSGKAISHYSYTLCEIVEHDTTTTTEVPPSTTEPPESNSTTTTSSPTDTTLPDEPPESSTTSSSLAPPTTESVTPSTITSKPPTESGDTPSETTVTFSKDESQTTSTLREQETLPETGLTLAEFLVVGLVLLGAGVTLELIARKRGRA